MRKVDKIAWAAGLFEGEGSIVIRPYSRKQVKFFRCNGWTRMLRVAMTDEDVVKKFRDVVGVGKIHPVARKKPHYKDQYVWVCSDWPNIKRILNLFLPFLCARRTAKAFEMLSKPARKPGGITKTHCKRGHPLRGRRANVYITKGGVIHCRACQR